MWGLQTSLTATRTYETIFVMENVNQQPLPPQQTEQVNSQLPSSGTSKMLLVLIIIVFIVLVGIISYTLGTRKTQTVVQSNQIAVSPTTPQSSPTPIDETANWKVYKNEKYAYELKYPTSFNTKEYGDYTQLTDGVIGLIVINYNTGVDQQILNTEQIKIGGENAKKYNHILEKFPNQVGFIIIQFSHNNKEFTITIQSLNQKPLSEDQIKTVDQILSTFKFIDQNTILFPATPIPKNISKEDNVLIANAMRLRANLEEYRHDYGSYPNSLQGLGKYSFPELNISEYRYIKNNNSYIVSTTLSTGINFQVTSP